ncbi:MAG: CRISPR-associated endonuclease Cas2 [Deltaproteobacteria bacterium]|nr:MAG: CRISPR-associated endonuclease Cas2 [Deltaproteobacteria bacterium]
MAERSLYLAAYDVRCPRRLRKALECAREFATGGQKSVHECFLNDTEKEALVQGMVEVLDLTKDSFLLIRLDPRAKTYTLGIGRPPVDPDVFYYG